MEKGIESGVRQRRKKCGVGLRRKAGITRSAARVSMRGNKGLVK